MSAKSMKYLMIKEPGRSGRTLFALKLRREEAEILGCHAVIVGYRKGRKEVWY